MKTKNSTLYVAYAEEEICTRKGIISLLGADGDIDVTIEAGDGQELIRKLEKAKEMPDVCMLAISMPEMNGFDTIRVLKKKWPDLGVVVLTSFNKAFYILRMADYGANAYLLKNSEPAEVRRALREVYKNGFFPSGVLNRRILRDMQKRPADMPILTKMEEQVLTYIGHDMNYRQIAQKMDITTRSVEGHKDSLFKKLNVNSKVALAKYAVQAGYAPMKIIKGTDTGFVN